jgi:mono/diheme cytochrome c family protein
VFLNVFVTTTMAVALCGVSAFAQEPSQAVTSGQIKAGAELYATNCSPCHGVRLDGTEMAFDLRKFPPGQRERFVTSVTRGKNQIAAVGRLLQAGPARCAVGLRVSWGEKLTQA